MVMDLANHAVKQSHLSLQMADILIPLINVKCRAKYLHRLEFQDFWLQIRDFNKLKEIKKT